MESFDLVSIQMQATECTSPRALFDLWEHVCRKYDRGVIGRYHLHEVKDMIWPRLRRLNILRRSIDRCYGAKSTYKDKRAGKRQRVTLAL